MIRATLAALVGIFLTLPTWAQQNVVPYPFWTGPYDQGQTQAQINSLANAINHGIQNNSGGYMFNGGSNATQPLFQENTFLTLNPKQAGAIGDGTLHTLASLGYTLQQAQGKCPDVQSLNDSIDWCAADQLEKYLETLNLNLGTTGVAGGGQLFFSGGHYIFNETLVCNNVALTLNGDGPGATTLDWIVAGQDGIHCGLNNQRVLATVPTIPPGGGGTGCGNGPQVMTLAGGTFTTAATLNVTVAGNTVSTINGIANGGKYSVIPPNTPAPITGGGCTGATVNLSSSQFTNPGGPLTIANLTATNSGSGCGGVFATASFGFGGLSTNSWVHDNIGYGGCWTQAAVLTSPSNFTWGDVTFAGTLGTSTVGVEIFAPQTGLGHFQYNWLANYCTKFAICWKYHMQGGPAIQGVTYVDNQAVNVGDMAQLVLDPGATAIAPPQWFFSHNQTQQEGFLLNCQTNCSNAELDYNLVLIGNGISGLTPPAEAGLFFQSAGANPIINGNWLDTLNTDVSNVTMIDSAGQAGQVGMNSMSNTAGVASATFLNLQSGSANWVESGDNIASGITAVSNAGGVLDAPTYQGQPLFKAGIATQGGSSFAQRTVTGDTTLGGNDQNVGTNFSVPHTITLMSAPIGGRTICVTDVAGTAAADNITVSGNGHNIGSAPNYVINTKGGSVCMVYYPAVSEWGIVSINNVPVIAWEHQPTVALCPGWTGTLNGNLNSALASLGPSPTITGYFSITDDLGKTHWVPACGG